MSAPMSADRVASFRRLGARVVAVEPQPAMVKVLKLFYGRSADVAIDGSGGRPLHRLDRHDDQRR